MHSNCICHQMKKDYEDNRGGTPYKGAMADCYRNGYNGTVMEREPMGQMETLLNTCEYRAVIGLIMSILFGYTKN